MKKQTPIFNGISHNVAGMSLSAIKEMAMLSSKVKDAVSLAWGLPSFQTPEYIRNAVVTKLSEDPNIGKYALPDGLPELRNLVVQKHFRETGVEVDPNNNVMITAGNMQGLNSLFHVVINPGDEIIMTDPGFASHIQQIRLCGGKPVFWQLEEENGWSLNLAKLPKLISKKTKAIVLVSPSNPTGKIFSREEMLRVCEIVREKNILLLLDDPYSNITYENKEKHFNPSSEKDFLNHIAYLFTFSKSYAMSGWRLGYMIIPEFLKKAVLKVHDATLICTPRISQVAGIAALSLDSAHLREFEAIFAKRRELICQRLDRVPHLFQYQKPEGAYYIFPKIVVPHKDSYAFSLQLLNEAKVTVTPGSAFGPSGEHHVRMAYCISEELIDSAFDRLENY